VVWGSNVYWMAAMALVKLEASKPTWSGKMVRWGDP